MMKQRYKQWMPYLGRGFAIFWLILGIVTGTSLTFAETEPEPPLPATEQPLAENEHRKAKPEEIFNRIHSAKGLSLHKFMYLLPATWSGDYHGEETEVEFQISAKQQLMNTSFYFAYTQKSLWQAYNSGDSSPFRETNYNPEFFYRLAPGVLPLGGFGADVGIEHESNGRNIPRSRSWDRIYVAPFYVVGKTLLYGKFWYRLPEDEKESPTDTNGDDNPDIKDYYGIAEINFQQQLYQQHLLHVMVRGNTATRRGAFSVSYNFPIFSDNLFLVLRLWHGYGETLIDYNNSVTRVGFGMMLSH